MSLPLLLSSSGRPPKGVIFDLDGTLVDSATGIEACLREVSRRLGRGQVRTDLVRALISRGVSELVSQNLVSPDEKAIVEDVAAFRGVLGKRRTPPEELFPGVMEGLGCLAQKIPALGICTNKPQYLTERVLDDTGIGPFFRAIIGGDTATTAKPDAAHVADVARGLGCPLSDCILVGDSEVDGAAATAAGVPFVLMTYGYAIGDTIEADYRFDRFADFASILLHTIG